MIQNPEALRPGDMLLFAGSDNSRRYADCVGHVEMVAAISGGKVTHNGKTWVSDIDGNVWEPGVYGWSEVTE